MSHVLIVDSDSLAAQYARTALEGVRHRVEIVGNGADALRALRRRIPDLLVLDTELPDQNGYDLCRRIRRDSEVGILFLSRQASAEDRVRGLQIGADDYLAKPCAASELVARVGAVLRRTIKPQRIGQDVVSYGSLTLDPVRQVALRERQPAADLTPREIHVLSYLMQRAGRVCPTNQIASHVWGVSDRQSRSIVATSIWRLRSKIEHDPQHPRHILTVRSIGYKFEP